jgi:hypothetical protein
MPPLSRGRGDVTQPDDDEPDGDAEEVEDVVEHGGYVGHTGALVDWVTTRSLVSSL